jgi:sulfide:quinone oxidoreductase
MTKNSFQIVVVGGGNAGISITAYLLRKNKSLDIAIVEPSEKHYYQPAWTLVGAGDYNIELTKREQQSVMPKKSTWIKARCESLQPQVNQLTLDNGVKLSYQYLIVCPGIQLNWSQIKGLPETLGKNGVCSNYSFRTAPYTFECLKNLKSGRVIFHNPHTPVKCGGAPHKIMYLAADYFRKYSDLTKYKIEYWSGAGRLFGVDKYEKTLLEVIKRGNIKLNFMERLEEIDASNKRARFVGFGEDNKDRQIWVDYDMIHVVPPQSAPDFIKNSPLAHSSGWVDVDKHTLQHNQFSNVFSLGDCANLPTSKTGAAIRKQVPIAANNLIDLMNNKPLSSYYNGYSSCPLVTGYGKLVLAEFDYSNKPTETFPFDQSKERYSMYLLKKRILPWLYWNQILKGKSQSESN